MLCIAMPLTPNGDLALSTPQLAFVSAGSADNL